MIAAVTGAVAVVVAAAVVLAVVLSKNDGGDSNASGTSSPSVSQDNTPPPTDSTAPPSPEPPTTEPPSTAPVTNGPPTGNTSGTLAMPQTAHGLSVVPPSRYPTPIKNNVDSINQMLSINFDNVNTKLFSDGLKATLVTLADRTAQPPSTWVKSFNVPAGYTEDSVNTTMPGVLRCFSGASSDCFWGNDKQLLYVSEAGTSGKAQSFVEDMYRGTAH